MVLGGALVIVGVLVGTLGILADLIATNRKLLEANMLKLRQIEQRLENPVTVSEEKSGDASHTDQQAHRVG